MKKRDDSLIFCENIKKLRVSSGLTKEEMSERLEVDIGYIESIEKGNIPDELGCDILFKIYKEFGVLPKDMF